MVVAAIWAHSVFSDREEWLTVNTAEGSKALLLLLLLLLRLKAGDGARESALGER
jgi:hypothetical protein